MPDAFIGLGSNLGDRHHTLAEALRRLHALPGTRVTAVSSLYATAPVGVTDQPEFLNCVARISTPLQPSQLLHYCLEIETSLGRVRRERWGPRTLDLDLLWHESGGIDTPAVTLPHPRAHERGFVLIPWAEIAPDLPLSGSTVGELARRCPRDGITLAAPAPFDPAAPPRSPLRASLRDITLPAAPELFFSSLAHLPHSVLLDSARPSGTLGRFTIMAWNPFQVITADTHGITLRKNGSLRRIDGDVLRELDRLLRNFQSEADAHWPFTGGAIGFFSYEFGRHLEPVGDAPPDDLDIPDVEFGFYDRGIVVDRETSRAIAFAHPASGASPDSIFAEIDALIASWKPSDQTTAATASTATAQPPDPISPATPTSPQSAA